MAFGAPSDAHLFHRRPCWYCKDWGGMVNSANARCEKDGHVVGRPSTGCAFFERLPGVDDDLWEPQEEHAADPAGPAAVGRGPARGIAGAARPDA